MSDYMKKLINGESIEEIGQKALNETLNQEIESSNSQVVRVTEKWEPKEWRPEYQIIVTLSSLGYSGEKIVEIMAEKYECSYTKQHVSNILNCELGKKEKERLLGNVVKKTELDVEQALTRMTDLAAQRLVQMLEDDTIYKNHPFAVADRSIKILEGRNKLRVQMTNGQLSASTQTNNFFNLPTNIQARIESGLSKLQQIAEIHGSTEGSNGEPEKRSGTDG